MSSSSVLKKVFQTLEAFASLLPYTCRHPAFSLTLLRLGKQEPRMPEVSDGYDEHGEPRKSMLQELGYNLPREMTSELATSGRL